MSIEINKEKCVGCNKCTKVCPGSLIKIGEDKKAYIKYQKDCWGCTSCLKECKYEAINFYLGADIGGCGSILNVDFNEEFINWKVEKPNGEKICISINRKESNSY